MAETTIPPSGNGATVAPTWNEAQARKLEALIQQAKTILLNQGSPTALPWISRGTFNGLFDPRRSIDDECGYPPTDSLTPDDYRNLFDREPVANRVVSAMPEECFQVSPWVYETADPEEATPFEQGWDSLSRNLSTEGNSWYVEEKGSLIWDYIYRADKLSGIGHFGILLLGIDDGKNLQEPIDGLVTINWRQEPTFMTNAAGEQIRTGARMVPDGYREIMPDSPPTAAEIRNLEAMVQNARADIGTLKPTYNRRGDVTGWDRESRLIDLQYLNDWRYTENAPRPAGFGKGPRLRPGVQSAASLGDVGAMGSFGAQAGFGPFGVGSFQQTAAFQGGTYRQGPGQSPFPPGSPAFQGTGRKPQKGGSRSERDDQIRASGGAGNAPPYSPFIQGTDRQYSGSIPPGGGQSANPGYVGGHPARPGDPAYPQFAEYVPQGHDPSTVFPSEQHAPTVPGYELGAGMGMPPAALSGTDQQYFGVQFGPSEQPSGRAGMPRSDGDKGDGGSEEEEDTSDDRESSNLPRRRLLFLRVYSEELVQIVRYEWNVFNPRFGLPVMYRVTLNDPREMHSGVGLPMATVFVHWTRVIHLADNRMSSEIFGVPRLRPVLTRSWTSRKCAAPVPRATGSPASTS
jgi:hypothetical protein